MRSFSLLGAGGMAGEIIAWLEKDFYEIDQIYDSLLENNTIKHGYPVSNEVKEDTHYLMAVGYPATKVKITDDLDKLLLADAFIHHLSVIGKNVYIGHGSVVYPLVVMTNNIKIGVMSSINSNVYIGHDVYIGQMFHASANSTVSGHVSIGDRVFLGANAVIKEYITICNDVIIGAGAVVVKDIVEPGKYAGNPVRKI